MTLQTHLPASGADQGGEPMLLGHYLTYQIARTHLCALAETATAEHLHDYWDVLDLIDTLHAPMQIAVARPIRGISRYAMYEAARHAITHLSRYGVDPVVLLEAHGLLDTTWAGDPGATR